MKDFLNDLLSLSTTERRGLIILVVLILLLFITSFYLKNRSIELETNQNKIFQEETDYFRQQLHGNDTGETAKNIIGDNEPIDEAEMFFFDPNTVSVSDLKRLGLNERIIKTLINYRKSGAKFRQKEDISKIYGMSPVLYKQLIPWVDIKEIRLINSDVITQAGITKIRTININVADTSAFEKLPGIGPVLSKRIVKYRSLLGGFYSNDQLTEIYGITPEVFQLVKSEIYTDTSAIRKINVNTASEYELSRHPYIGKYLARGIIAYRSEVKYIKSLDELSGNGIVADSNLLRLKNYLSIL
jgi:competence protein ComEA